MSSSLLISLAAALLSFVLGGVGSFLVAKLKGAKRREKSLSEGLQSLLRSEIIAYHEKYVERGYCPIYAKEAAGKCYEAYHGLGGNGVITKLYGDLMALPESPKSN